MTISGTASYRVQPGSSAQSDSRRRARAMLLAYLCHVGIAIGAVLAVLKRDIIPERFFYDEQRLIQFVNAPGIISRDGSYRGTAEIYKLVGLGNADLSVVSLLSFAAFALLLVRYVPVRSACASVTTTALFCATSILGAIFVAGLTKEFLIVVLLLLRPQRVRRWPLEAAWILVAVGYAVMVREYWLLILAIYLGFRIVARWMPIRTAFFVFLVPLIVLLVLAFTQILGVPLNFYRTSVVETLSVNPDSVIIDPLPPSSIINQVINGLWAVIVLVIPIPLIRPNPTQFATFVFVGFIWLRFFRALAPSNYPGIDTARVTSAAAISLAYVVTLSLFEPDFGSYTRHLTPFLPLVLYVATQRVWSGRRVE